MKKLILPALFALCILVSCKANEPEASPIPTPEPTASVIAPSSEAPPSTPEGSPDPETGIPDITDTIHTQTIVISETHVLDVSLRYPETGIEAIDDYYETVLEGTAEFAETLAEELRSYDDQGTFSLQYMLYDDYEIVKNSDDIFSVHRTVFQYTGGVHGNHGDACESFRISDGKRLTLNDIFDCTQDEYIEDLCGVFDRFIDEYSEGPEGYGFFSDAKITLRDMFPLREFCITDTGLNFYISPYFVTPYASGTVVIPVAWSELSVPLKVF